MHDVAEILTYAPEVFIQPSVADARSIILTPEVGLTTEERWARETPWLAERMKSHTGLVLDIGCGVGRMSKVFVERGHFVLGVDISPTMRRDAESEVADPAHFAAISPHVLRGLVEGGLRAQAALAVWTFQHIPATDLAEMIGILAVGLIADSPLWTVDAHCRFLPVRRGGRFGWADDGIDVPKALTGPFQLEWHEPMPPDLCAPGSTLRCWIRCQEE